MGTRTDKLCSHYKAIYSVKGQIRIRIMVRTYGITKAQMSKVKGKAPTDPQSLTMMQFDELLQRGDR